MLQRRSLQSTINDGLRLLQDAPQVILSQEALGVYLVDILCPRWARGEPPTLGNHLYSADGSTVARRMGKQGLDLFAGQICESNLFR